MTTAAAEVVMGIQAAANSRSFDWKVLSLKRSGTASVVTTSPHAEFPDQRSGRLFGRSSNGGGMKAAIMVLFGDGLVFCDSNFLFTRGRVHLNCNQYRLGIEYPFFAVSHT
jgi:hypothetical protein